MASAEARVEPKWAIKAVRAPTAVVMLRPKTTTRCARKTTEMIRNRVTRAAAVVPHLSWVYATRGLTSTVDRCTDIAPAVRRPEISVVTSVVGTQATVGVRVSRRTGAIAMTAVSANRAGKSAMHTHPVLPPKSGTLPGHRPPFTFGTSPLIMVLTMHVTLVEVFRPRSSSRSQFSPVTQSLPQVHPTRGSRAPTRSRPSAPTVKVNAVGAKRATRSAAPAGRIAPRAMNSPSARMRPAKVTMSANARWYGSADPKEDVRANIHPVLRDPNKVVNAKWVSVRQPRICPIARMLAAVVQRTLHSSAPASRYDWLYRNCL